MGPLVIEAREFKSEVKFYPRGQLEVIVTSETTKVTFKSLVQDSGAR